MLVDIQYAKQDRAKNIPDCLYVIWKDLETNQKHVQTIENPSMPIYFEKDECINHKYNVDYRELEDCEKKVVKYSEIPCEIAKRMGDSGKQFLQNIFETKNYKELRMLNMYPYVFGTILIFGQSTGITGLRLRIRISFRNLRKDS